LRVISDDYTKTTEFILHCIDQTRECEKNKGVC
jgi:hypothetical protein